jgi:hypothetical protein
MSISEVACLVLSACLTLSACSTRLPQRKPNRYLIPEGYVGWLTVKYQVRSAPALPIEDGRYLVIFPVSGQTQTSLEQEYGWANDEYFYYSPDGKRRLLRVTGWGGGGMIWAESTGKDVVNGDEVIFGRFFLGTEEEFRRKGSPVSSITPNP